MQPSENLNPIRLRVPPPSAALPAAELEAPLEATLEAIQDGVAVVDQQGQVLMANGSLFRILGLEDASSSLAGLDLRYFYTRFQMVTDDGPLSTDHWPVNRALSGEKFQGLEVSCRRVNTGELLTLSFSGGPIRDAEGRVLRAVVVCRDVSEQKQAGYLRATLEARDEFLSTASHELKTPLTSLHVALQLIRRLSSKDSPISPEQLAQLTDRALASSEKLAQLIDELLDLARIRAGMLRLERCEVDLRDCVSSALSQASEEAARRGVTLSISAERSVVGFWDPIRINQVVDSLLSYAIRFGEGGPIVLRVSARDGEVARLEIEDQRPGISQQMQEQVLEQFDRANPRKNPGLELGLYIARETVETHGGRIWVESEKGRGSRFVVELPLVGRGDLR